MLICYYCQVINEAKTIEEYRQYLPAEIGENLREESTYVQQCMWKMSLIALFLFMSSYMQ